MFEWHAGLIRRAGKMLAHTIDTTEPNKREWCPAAGDSSKCRPVLDQAAECVRVNETFAARLSGREPSEPAPVDASNASSRVRASADGLAAVVRNLKPEDLSVQHQLPWGPMPASGLIEIAMANMHYHAGQINQIQLLYGDTEFRVPPDFFD